MNVDSRISLGRGLVRLRNRKGLTLEEAAEASGISRSQLSKIELGKHLTKPDKVRLLAQVYEATETEIERLLAMLPARTRKAAKESPDWAADYYHLENEAVAIHSYDAQLVPGLLQTPAYARALAIAANTEETTPDQVVDLRIRRQQKLLDDANPLFFRTILDEAVVTRLVGGPEVMANQIDHILDISRRDNVTVTLLPFRVGAHIAMTGSFQLLQLAPQLGMDTVYIEHDRTGLRLTTQRDLERYTVMIESLESLSLSPADSREHLRSVAHYYRQERIAKNHGNPG